jgi:hypothetical protein
MDCSHIREEEVGGVWRDMAEFGVPRNLDLGEVMV